MNANGPTLASKTNDSSADSSAAQIPTPKKRRSRISYPGTVALSFGLIGFSAFATGAFYKNLLVDPLNQTNQSLTKRVGFLETPLNQQQQRLAIMLEKNGLTAEKGLLLPDTQKLLRQTFVLHPNMDIPSEIRNPHFRILVLNADSKIKFLLDPEKSKIDACPDFFAALKRALENGDFQREFAQKVTVSLPAAPKPISAF